LSNERHWSSKNGAPRDPQNGAGTQQSAGPRPRRPKKWSRAVTRSSLGDLQRIREWIILLARHDSGTKRGILLSRPKNNRYNGSKLTAMSFSGTSVSACRIDPDNESVASESIAASSGYCLSKPQREAVPARLHAHVLLAFAGHRVRPSGHSEAANLCRPAARGSDNASRHTQRTQSHPNRSINSELGGRADG
jgi:hypothetical protein